MPPLESTHTTRGSGNRLIARRKKFWTSEFGGAKPAECGRFHGEFAANTIDLAGRSSRFRISEIECVRTRQGPAEDHIGFLIA
jgi:hypothetical protein